MKIPVEERCYNTLNQDAQKILRVRERKQAWERTWCDRSMLVSIGLDTTSAGLAIAQAWLDQEKSGDKKSNPSCDGLVIIFATASFVLLFIGNLFQVLNNTCAMREIRKFRIYENAAIIQALDVSGDKQQLTTDQIMQMALKTNTTAVGALWGTNGTLGVSFLAGVIGTAILISGSCTNIPGLSLTGVICNIAAPLIALIGFTLTLSRFDKEKEIILERYTLSLNKLVTDKNDKMLTGGKGCCAYCTMVNDGWGLC